MTESQTFQLEIFNGREYVLQMRASDRRASESLAELGRRIGMPWRVVRPEKAWPAKPSYRRGAVHGPLSVTDGSHERMRATVRSYLEWAQAHGLQTVTVYRGSWAEREAVQFDRRVVDVSDFLGDPPAAEMED
jgi:hypothetical protein